MKKPPREMDVKNITLAEMFSPEKMSKVNLFESARFFCDLYCLLPGQEQKVHTHTDNDKIYSIVRGEARVTIGDETRTLRPGEIVLAPAGVPHGIRNESAKDTVSLVFMAPHPSPASG